MPQQTPHAPRPVVLRPPRRILTTGTLAVLALTSPIFAVLYWLTVPNGSGAITFGAHLALLGAAALAALGYADIRVELTDERIVSHGFFRPEHVTALSAVHDALMVEVYHGDALETAPQLFLRDAAGGLLLRMRGQLWGRPALTTVVDHVGSPVKSGRGPMTAGELRATWPQLLAWFERRPHLISHNHVKNTKRR